MWIIFRKKLHYRFFISNLHLLEFKTAGEQNMKKQQGFTLIELMIVVAIIGILAAIALPAYQDYTARAKVAEGLTMSNSMKTTVTEYFATEGLWPSAASAGLTAAVAANDSSLQYSTVTSGALTTGRIVITYGAAVAPSTGNTLTLDSTLGGSSITWSCDGSAIVNKNILPKSCK